MIARMSKYDFILYAGQSDDFIERLRELGLVDVTCRGWEPSEGDRQLVTAIEGRTKALAALERFRSSEHFDAAARPFASGDEAYERYGRTAQERAALRTEIGQTEKAAEEARPWGDFSAGTLQRLARRGVVLRFFTAQRDAFEKSRDAWNEQAPVEVIHETSSTVWFVAVSHEGAELSFDAQEVKAPAMTAHDAEAKVASLRSRLSATDAEMSRAAGVRRTHRARLQPSARRVAAGEGDGHRRGGRRRHAADHGGMGRTGDVGSGGRPAGRISQRALHQERPHARKTRRP